MRKKIMMLPVVLFFFIVISANNIYAADCASATIKRIGVVPAVASSLVSPYMVQLDCSNDAIWPGTLQLFLSAGVGESGLATLLTATSLGKTVWVRTLGTTTGSVVTIVYMNN